jgi:phospholipid/cholesterol/gamma-HCH transport system substrate-binding protein
MSQSVRVGIFMAICLAILAALIIKVEDLQLIGPTGKRVDAVFDQVAGLDDKAPVRVAGVRVGRVDGIHLDGHRARVTLLLESKVDLAVGATARIATTSLLGDKYVELDPGPAGGKPLPEGTVLQGTTPISFDQAMAKLNDLAGSIQQVTGSLAGGEGGENGIPALMASLKQTSDTIRQLVEMNQQQVSATINNFQEFSGTLARELPKLTAQLHDVLAQVDNVLTENRSNLRASMQNIRDISASLHTSVENLNAITTKMASGEGTIGKLINSDEAHDELVSTLDSIKGGVDDLSQTFRKINQIHIDLGAETYYLNDPKDYRSSFRVNIRPNEDRFYRIGFVDDPSGRTTTKTEVITTTPPDGTSSTTTVQTVKTRDERTIDAQFGFNLGHASLRGGLFQSHGGAGIDYAFPDQRLAFSLEAFDFNRQGDLQPRVRLFGRWTFHPHLYVIGGMDDILEADHKSVFFGAGVTWSDDDLKYLLGSVPRP